MSSQTSSHSSSNQSSRSRRRHHRNAARAFIVLHSVNAIFAFISFSIFVTIIPIWNANFFHSTGSLRGDWPDGLPMIPLFLTFIASAHYLVRILLARRKSVDYLKSRQSSQRPSKVRLYLTLTTLVLLLTFIILSGISGLYRFWRPAVITSSVQLASGSATLSTLSVRTTESNPSLTPTDSSAHNAKATFHSCTLANVFTRKCNPTLYLIGDLQIAAIATGALVWFLNLIILVLQVRDHQYQKRKHQRSIRAKAKAKLDVIEDEMSRAEKGVSSKKIHHEKKHKAASSEPTHPARAYMAKEQNFVRPKQHFYNPNISPSRTRSTRQHENVEAGPGNAINSVSSMTIHPTMQPTPYSRAVEEARRKVKPAESMQDWLAGRR